MELTPIEKLVVLGVVGFAVGALLAWAFNSPWLRVTGHLLIIAAAIWCAVAIRRRIRAREERAHRPVVRQPKSHVKERIG